MDVGTFPKPPHNAPDEIVNYDLRIPVEDGAFQAWGHLTYTRPLSNEQMRDYELRPSRDNPRLLGKRQSIADLLKEGQRLAGEQRTKPGPGKDTPDRDDR